MKNNLKKILSEKKITLKKLGIDTDINSIYLSKLANNKVIEIKTSYLEKICTALSITPNDFFGYETPFLDSVIGFKITDVSENYITLSKI
jgi:DNA-binding Xre family transcriptional regulator